MVNTRVRDFTRKTQKDYSLSFKLMVVEEVEKVGKALRYFRGTNTITGCPSPPSLDYFAI
jgi:hypothetical protein